MSPGIVVCSISAFLYEQQRGLIVPCLVVHAKVVLCCRFEMECTRTPHALRFHKGAVRGVAFHRKYPLFASVSDEGRIIVSHGMVYE